MNEKGLAAVVVLIGLVLLGWSFIPGIGPQETEYAGTTLTLTQDPDKPITEVTYQLQKNKQDQPNKLRPTPPAGVQTGPVTEVTYSLEGLPPAWYTINVTRGTGEKAETLPVVLQVLDKRYGFMAALGALLTVLAAPYVLLSSTRVWTRVGNIERPITGWLYLLMEPTGLSLARTQLILLFVPTIVAYLALSFPLHYFPTMPDSLWQLLGIGGATAALSAMMSPKGSDLTASTSLPVPDNNVAAAAMAPPGPMVTAPVYQPVSQDNPLAGIRVFVQPPTVTDLFQEANGFGDISRYQSMIMCCATAVTFTISFFDYWVMPDIPPQILQLLGTSLAVYLGVKGIRVMKK